MTDAVLALIANADDGTVGAFRLDPGAAEPELQALAVSNAGEGCGTFAVDAARLRVYVGHKGEPAGVSTFDLDAATGELRRLSTRPTESSMTYLALSHDGRRLFSASYGGGYGTVWPVAEDGSLGEPTARLEYPNLHCVALAGAHAYFVSLGADLIAQYRVDDAGALHPLDPPTVSAPAGSGPRHLVFDAEHTCGYLITEFSGEVIRLPRDGRTGALSVAESVPGYATDRGLRHSVLGADPREHHYIWGADVHVGGGGAWLLASERCESTLACIALGADGTLGERLDLVDVEAQPRGFAVSPDARHALVVGERSTMASLYRIDDDGRLGVVQRVPGGHGANWVRFVTVADPR